MAAADTAKLLASLDFKDNLTPGVKKAIGSTQGLESRFASLGSGAAKMGGTVSKGLSNLAGNLSRIGIAAAASLGVAGVFSVGGALTTAITKAKDFGEAIDKTMSMTGLGVEKASALSSALAYVGVDGEAMVKMLGMAEKNLGALTTGAVKGAGGAAALTKAQQNLRIAQLKLNETQSNGKASASSLLAAHYKVANAEKALAAAKKVGVGATSKAIDFQKLYGMSLLDSNGKTVDANELLLRSADLYTNKNIPAATKAIALSKIYGKAWQNNIEVFELGRTKLAAVESEMQAAGLTMTPENMKAWEKFRDVSRSATGAISGLELQLGLLVMPDLAAGMQTFTDYVRTHQGDIKEFFKNGIKAAKDLAGFITGTVVPALSTIAGAATKIWGSIPAPMQQLLAGGFVLNKLTGGAVSDLIGQLGKGLIKGVLGMNAGVVNINAAVVNGGGGLPGGGLPGAVGTGAAAETGWAAGGIAGLAAVAVSVIGSAAVAAAIIGLEIKATGMTPEQASSPQHGVGGPRTAAQGVNFAGLGGSADRATAGGGNIPPAHGSADRATAGGGAASFWASVPKNISVTLAAIGSGAGGVYERAIAKGLHPTMKAVTGTLAKNKRITAELTAIGPGAAGVYKRGIHDGIAPSMASVAATLAKNVAAAKAATAAAAKGAAAASKTTAAVFAGAEKTGARLLGVQRTIAAKNYRPNITTMVTVPVTVNTSVSVRDVLGRVATYGSYGKVRAIGKVGGW